MRVLTSPHWAKGPFPTITVTNMQLDGEEQAQINGPLVWESDSVNLDKTAAVNPGKSLSLSGECPFVNGFLPFSPVVSHTIVFEHCADNRKSGEEENHLADDQISYEPFSGNDRPSSPVVGEHQTTASVFTKSSSKTMEPRDGGSGKLSDSQCCDSFDADESSLESFQCSTDVGYDFKLSSSLSPKNDNRSGKGSVTVNRDNDNYDGCSPR